MSLCTIYNQGNDLRTILEDIPVSPFPMGLRGSWHQWREGGKRGNRVLLVAMRHIVVGTSETQAENNLVTMQIPVCSRLKTMLGYCFRNASSLEVRDNWWSAAVRSPYLRIFHHDESAMSKSHLPKATNNLHPWDNITYTPSTVGGKSSLKTYFPFIIYCVRDTFL
jgi:hypothetical protein